MNKNYTTLHQIQVDLNSRTITCENLVRGYLENISKNQSLNAFNEVFTEESIQRSIRIDKKITDKKAGLLAGLVIGIKDNICYMGHRSEASSNILKGFVANYSATVVDRLLSEDAIIIGRLNCDEFAMGSGNENSIYGPVQNPISPHHVPGGSSGGSAASVKANLCHLALGTDTGGSIRQPAAFCGVIGLKPTYGLVSRYGLIAYASSFDQIGPIGKSFDDIGLVTHVISGSDDFDTTCIGEKMPIKKQLGFNKKSFAVVEDAIKFAGIDNEIREEFNRFLATLKKNGHTINYVKLPLLEYLVPTYYILTTAEASSNLSRYDGIKFGLQVPCDQIDTLITKTRTEGFGPEVKRRIMLGNFVLSQGYYDAYYKKAQQVRTLIKNQTEQILSNHDHILLPTTPNKPFKIGEETALTKRYYEDVFTVQANLSGHPALAFPLGKMKDGFFASAQLIGKYFSENELIQTANQITRY